MAGTTMLAVGMGGDSGVVSRAAAYNATLKMVAWADRVGVTMWNELKATAPVGVGPTSGKMRESIDYTRTTRLGGVQLSFHSNDPAVRYVIEGTKPHLIEAHGHALHFFARDGREVFTRSVNHPGIRHPNNFPQKAVDKLMPEFIVSFAGMFREI